jgi:hypothetical protein
MYAIAEKQVLIGVCFDGMQKLNKQRQLVNLPIELKMHSLELPQRFRNSMN